MALSMPPDTVHAEVVDDGKPGVCGTPDEETHRML